MAPLRIGLFLLVCAFFSEASAGAIPSDLKAIHVLNRLAYGPRPGDLKRVKAIGIEQYLKEQLAPEAIPIPPALASRLDGLSTLRLTPARIFAEYNPPPAGKKGDPEAAKLAQQRARIVMEEAS